MAKRFDWIVVIDVESTCWAGTPPPGQVSEIVEIGVCPVDVAALQRLAKPEHRWNLEPVAARSAECYGARPIQHTEFAGIRRFGR